MRKFKELDSKPVATKTEIWSGAGPIPNLGDVVNVRVNSMGPAEVLGYFLEDDYIGVIVKLLAPSGGIAERIAKGEANRTGVFGAELKWDVAPSAEKEGSIGTIDIDSAFAADSDFVAALMRLANAGALKLRNMTLDDFAKASTENIPFMTVVAFAIAGADSAEDIAFTNELATAVVSTSEAA